MEAVAVPETKIDEGATAFTLEQIERLEGALLECEPAEIPVVHHFSPGVYIREARFPAGVVAIGHQHRFRHLNVVSAGRFSVIENGTVRQVQAPATFVSEPGVRKIAYFHEDTVWSNVLHNPDNITEPDQLEDAFIVKSETWLRHKAVEAAHAPEQLPTPSS